MKHTQSKGRARKWESAPDFYPENYEANYRGRETLDDLSDIGKKQMGLMPW